MAPKTSSGRITGPQVALALVLLATCILLACAQQQSPPRLFPTRRSQGPARSQTQVQPQNSSAGTAVEVAPPANAPVSATSANRTTRTADVFQNGEGYNLFVTNTCERDLMRVNIKTSRPFYGMIHTRGQRQKSGCSVEGDGSSEYNLDISHALNPLDPAYCGVIRARRDSPDQRDTLSVVVAVRVHRVIELPDDKFFLLNCTNRCRRPDCSSSAKLVEEETTSASPAGERETSTSGGGEPDECTIYKFPWMITLLWILGILLLFSLISHCVMCSSLVCRCVKTEVEEREPSEFDYGDSDLDNQLDSYDKKRPNQIEYDNRQVYKTPNNYQPYSLEEAQAKSRRRQRH